MSLPPSGLQYPFGDDRDILGHIELAQERRKRQEEAMLQQIEAFRSSGVRIVYVDWLAEYVHQRSTRNSKCSFSADVHLHID